MRKVAAALLAAALAAWGANATLAQGADTTAGQKLFQQRCGACHQIETTRNGVGPHLQGVVSRAAGSVEGFNYSPALKSSGITWNDETLEAYLANPTAMVRGTRMTQRFSKAEERRTIIDFLSSQ